MMKDIFNEMMAPSGAEVSIIPVMQTDGVMQVDEAQLPDSLPIVIILFISLPPRSILQELL